MSEREFEDIQNEHLTDEYLKDPARLVEVRKRIIETGHESSEGTIVIQKSPDDKLVE